MPPDWEMPNAPPYHSLPARLPLNTEPWRLWWAYRALIGLAYEDDLFRSFTGGAFIGQHGSWNRQPRSGYKVIFVPFSDGRPDGTPEDLLTGFVSAQDEALGRPVGAVDRVGALLVADDVGNIVWRVPPAIAK